MRNCKVVMTVTEVTNPELTPISFVPGPLATFFVDDQQLPFAVGLQEGSGMIGVVRREIERLSENKLTEEEIESILELVADEQDKMINTV